MSLGGVPLALTSVGERVEVTTVAGGPEMRARLAGLGVATGSRVKIVRKEGGGQMVVALGDARFALGRELAQRIFVTPEPK